MRLGLGLGSGSGRLSGRVLDFSAGVGASRVPEGRAGRQDRGRIGGGGSRWSWAIKGGRPVGVEAGGWIVSGGR